MVDSERAPCTAHHMMYKILYKLQERSREIPGPCWQVVDGGEWFVPPDAALRLLEHGRRRHGCGEGLQGSPKSRRFEDLQGLTYVLSRIDAGLCVASEQSNIDISAG